MLVWIEAGHEEIHSTKGYRLAIVITYNAESLIIHAEHILVADVIRRGQSFRGPSSNIGTYLR